MTPGRLRIQTIILVLLFCSVAGAFDLPHERPETGGPVFDYAGIITGQSALEAHLNTLLITADIEMLVVTLPSLDGREMNSVSAGLMTDWRVGGRTKGLRGILFLLAVKEKTLRLEVGYDLEWMFPDGFVGYLEQDQMTPFFELGRISDGLAAGVEMVVARAYEQLEEHGTSLQTDGGTYSGGAGAGRKVDIGSIRVPEIIPYSGEVKEYLSAQPTPALAVLRNIEKNRRHIKGADFDLYTDETRIVSRDWPFTPAQMDNEVKALSGKDFRIYGQGDLAVAVFPPRDRQAAPYLLSRSAKGWQIDLASMRRFIRFDMRNRFHVYFKDNPYLSLFLRNYAFDQFGYLYEKGQEPPYTGLGRWEEDKGGIIIKNVIPGGPADKAGLRTGDLILRVDGAKTSNNAEFYRALRKCGAGRTALLEIKGFIRNKTVPVTLERFDPAGFSQQE